MCQKRLKSLKLFVIVRDTLLADDLELHRRNATIRAQRLRSSLGNVDMRPGLKGNAVIYAHDLADCLWPQLGYFDPSIER